MINLGNTYLFLIICWAFISFVMSFSKGSFYTHVYLKRSVVKGKIIRDHFIPLGSFYTLFYIIKIKHNAVYFACTALKKQNM